MKTIGGSIHKCQKVCWLLTCISLHFLAFPWCFICGETPAMNLWLCPLLVMALWLVDVEANKAILQLGWNLAFQRTQSSYTQIRWSKLLPFIAKPPNVSNVDSFWHIGSFWHVVCWLFADGFPRIFTISTCHVTYRETLCLSAALKPYAGRAFLSELHFFFQRLVAKHPSFFHSQFLVAHTLYHHIFIDRGNKKSQVL